MNPEAELQQPSHAGSPEQLLHVTDHARAEAIFLLDRDGRVRTWNPRAQLINGYAASEIVGRPIDVLYTQEAQAAQLPDRLLHRAATDGRAENESWQVRKDGTRFRANIVITAITDCDGGLTGYAEVTRELTANQGANDEQRRHERLWRSEDRFRLLVESVEEYAIFMLDPQGMVATWNVGAERIKGYRGDEIIGKHFSVFRSDEEVRSGVCEQELAMAKRDGKLAQEGWRVRKDGSRFWASVLLTALRDSTGELLGFAKVTRDLTERRQLEEERVQRARVEEAIRLHDEFLLAASHELATPLTSLQIDLYQLRREPADAEKVHRRLERAIRNVERLNSLIESLLSASRAAYGKLALQPALMDLRESAAQVIDIMTAQAIRSGCAVRLQADSAVVGVWDRLRIEQVLMNLLSNAFKYGAGGPVVVSVSASESDAVLMVRDRGLGVPPADMQRIFERFERASSISQLGGLGLGLYISREIVRAHGGKITVANNPEGGAELTVRLPLCVRNGEPDVTAE